jgi:polyhydroxybutyrate depolymerase
MSQNGISGNALAKKIEKTSIFFIIVIALSVNITSCGTAVPTSTPPTDTPAPTLQPGDSNRTVKIDEQDRTYLLHIPPGVERDHPLPVVFLFHGYDSEIAYAMSGFQQSSGFNEISDKNGFLAVYPIGISGMWNAGRCCGTAFENNIDDIGYVRQILSDLGRTFTLDEKRIYASGLSMGGMMSFRLACELPDIFAAIAPVAGALVLTPCEPNQPVSIMQVHGKKDTAIPYSGGNGGFMSGKYTFPAVENEISAWRKIDGCSETAKSNQEGIAMHTIFPDCRGGSSVDLYTIDAMGANWPSQYVLPLSQMIWDFFKAHPKQ